MYVYVCVYIYDAFGIQMFIGRELPKVCRKAFRKERHHHHLMNGRVATNTLRKRNGERDFAKETLRKALRKHCERLCERL